MRNLICAAVLLLSASFASAQCVETANDPCQLVNQSLLDRSAKAIDELKAARITIAAFVNERGATENERAAYKNLAAVSEQALTILQRGINDRDRVIELQDKVIQTLMQLNEKLQNKIDAPKSAWSKFLSTLKTVGAILAGVSIGRGL